LLSWLSGKGGVPDIGVRNFLILHKNMVSVTTFRPKGRNVWKAWARKMHKSAGQKITSSSRTDLGESAVAAAGATSAFTPFATATTISSTMGLPPDKALPKCFRKESQIIERSKKNKSSIDLK
jgi:hypothetical protein